jgi:OOP family OmpA-OmpF porin
MINLSHTIIKKSIILIAFFALVNTTIVAQSYNKSSSFKSYWQINASGGTSLFFGDIKQYQFWPVSSNENEWRFAGGLMLNKQISPVFGIRGQVIYGNLAGTRRSMNKYFESNYIEFNLNTTVSIRNIISKYKAKQFWDAYIIVGIGITNYNTELKDLTTKQVLREVGYGNGKSFGGRTLQGILTGGLGLDFRLSDKWNINLESSNKIMNSDDMDAWVSGFIYDVYNYTSIGISYKFGVKKKSKENDEYNYFEKKENDINETEYDHHETNPVEPPKVDALDIVPIVAVSTYKEEPIEVIVIKEEPIEAIIIKEAAITKKYAFIILEH